MSTDMLKEIAVNLCKEHGCKLIYLTRAGSHRYGTTTPESDIDADGIFIIPKEKLLLGEKINQLKYNTGNDKTKNTNEDVDIQLYSVHYFLKYLLLKCDTNAIDILYSHTNESSIIFNDPTMSIIFDNKNKLIEISEIMKFSYAACANDQARRYGIKGNKLKTVKNICEYCDNFNKNPEDYVLEDCADELLGYVGETNLFKKEVINRNEFLMINGKLHQYTIPMSEFINRMRLEPKRFGSRATQAELNGGIDWKALSCAVKVIYQMEELCETGGLKFPLEKANEIRDIKLGLCNYEQVKKTIEDGLERLELLNINDISFKGKRDEDFINNLILDLY